MSVAFSLLFRASADLLPGSPVRSGPNLRASRREQNHGAKSELGIARAADVKHKDARGNSSADPNRAPRVKRDRPGAAGLRDERCATQGCGDGSWTRGHPGWQKGREAGDQLLFVGCINSAARIRIGPDEPSGSARLHQEIDLFVQANRFEPSKL